MSLEINEKELASVTSLEGRKRYSYFIKRVADFEEVWSLAGAEGRWCLAAEPDGGEVVPVWPARRYAEVCAAGEWADSEPKSINLDLWLERWTPGMIRDGRRVTVFPTPGARGVVVDPARLADDLAVELRLYE